MKALALLRALRTARARAPEEPSSVQAPVDDHAADSIHELSRGVRVEQIRATAREKRLGHCVARMDKEETARPVRDPSASDAASERVVCRWCPCTQRRPDDLPPHEPTLDCGSPECRARSAAYREELRLAGPAALPLPPDSPLLRPDPKVHATCRGCRQHMQATPEALCFSCHLGLDRPDFPSKLLPIAQELAAKLGPAGRRGARVERIRAVALERGLNAAVALLDKRPRWSLVEFHGSDLLLEPDDVVEPGADPGTALLRSETYGEIWLAYDAAMVNALAAEEALRAEPRPVVYGRDIARLRGKREAAIRAALEVARAFPGARVLQ